MLGSMGGLEDLPCMMNFLVIPKESLYASSISAGELS